MHKNNNIIRLIAVIFFCASVVSLFDVFFGNPAYLFGLLFNGFLASLLHVFITIVNFYIALSLWRLNKEVWILSILWLLIIMINGLFYIALVNFSGITLLAVFLNIKEVIKIILVTILLLFLYKQKIIFLKGISEFQKTHLWIVLWILIFSFGSGLGFVTSYVSSRLVPGKVKVNGGIEIGEYNLMILYCLRKSEKETYSGYVISYLPRKTTFELKAENVFVGFMPGFFIKAEYQDYSDRPTLDFIYYDEKMKPLPDIDFDGRPEVTLGPFDYKNFYFSTENLNEHERKRLKFNLF